MPVYEYRCEGCGEQFEAKQSVSANPSDTECPRCHAFKATRLMSSFASKIVGEKKPTFTEMKAYNMLNERMDKFSKLPPMMGKRTDMTPRATSPSGGGEGGTQSSE